MFGLSGSTMWRGLSLQAWAYALGAVLLIAVASAGIGYGFGHGDGKVAGLKENQAKLDKAVADRAAEREAGAKALAEANARNRAQELAHEQRVAALRVEFATQQATEAAADARRLADLRSGNDHLRLRVASCEARPYPTDTSWAGPSAPGAYGPAYAELAPEVGAALYGIAADGDSAIRQLNKLIDWTESAVKACPRIAPKLTGKPP